MGQINFDSYINTEKKEYIRPGYRAEYGGKLTHRIDIRDAKKGTRFYIEPAHSTPPVVMQSASTSGPTWEHSMTELEDIRRERYGGGSPAEKTDAGALTAGAPGTAAEARTAGISPDYLTVTAQSDGSYIRVANGLVGEVFCLQCGEVPFLVRPGSFIMCEQGVVLDIRLVDNSSFITDITGFGSWMEISGEGLCFLQGGSKLDVMELEPGEVVRCRQGLLMGMTDSVKIVRADPFSDDPAVRAVTEAEYELVLQADDRGGLICVSDMPSEYHTL